MGNEENTPPPSESDGTRIDLGDDLIEKTALLSGATAPAETEVVEVPDLADQLQSARILLNEKLTEDAKKVLHKIVFADPRNASARAMLDEIHAMELKEIFGGDGGGRRVRVGASLRPEPEQRAPSSEDVLLKLDRDLDLGVFSVRPSLFADAGGMKKFGDKLDRDFAGLPGFERIDLGVAFLEMGMPEVAIRQFAAAARAGGAESRSAKALLAYAMIVAGRAFDATLELQGVIGDSEVPLSEKIEFFYLMGRAFENMGKRDVAMSWYSQVLAQDAQYRDVRERLRSVSE